MAAPLLRTENLRKTFAVGGQLFKAKRAIRAVDGVTISVSKGSVLGLVGESGCGKTTLVRMVLGLERPTSGHIAIDGTSIDDLERSTLARNIQAVFQDPYSSLNPRKSVGSIVSLPLRVHKVGDRIEWRRAVEEILERVGLPRALYFSYPSQLSGGQRQRVAIARALIMRPSLVICDEPTSALDVSVQAQILNLLQDLQRDLDLTYIVISHNLSVVEHISTRVAVMYLGRIVEEADTQSLFSSPRHPYTQALLASVLTPEPSLGVPHTHLGESLPDPVNLPSGCTFHPRCPQSREVCSRVAPRLRRVGDTWVECHLYDPATGTDSAASGNSPKRTGP